jgi:hypothetical protein
MEALMSASNEGSVPVVVLKAPKRNKEFITYARAIYGSLLDNPNFPSPNPPLSTVAVNIAAFEDAETKAATRAKGAASLRDAKKKRVKDDLFQLRAYVQGVVNTSPTPADAIALIESAFMSVKKVTKRPLPELSVKNTDVSGKVKIAAKAVGRPALYTFEYSTDQSNWIALPNVMKSRTEASGLTSACVHYFRFRTFTRDGQQDYSQVVSLVVH